ncbi:hypothetical protein [Yersinia intermedia]|uniref:hypothetical protein n=1 Tax=Yersinia intermedia TaxID=631 RepID=UPI001CFEAA2A|nr:hypothetical protein [Yersinia intermedia]MCB5313615.1 hypothetical protein [Yersinia intermedia]
MMDITKSREEFEAWWNAPEQAELRNSCAMGWGFRIWKASRESIEVELPEYQAEDYYQNAGYNAAIDDCSSILRTAGIRIKGESE